METRSLRAFLKVAESGSLTYAATALNLTQSSLSRIITGLEQELGGPLFHRTGRGMALTGEGEAALPRVRSILAESDALGQLVHDRATNPTGAVALAMMSTLTSAVAGPLFEEIRQRHPHIRLRLMEGFSASIGEWVADGRADIGLVSRYRKSDVRGDEVLGTSYLMLVGSGAAATTKRDIGLRDAAKLPLVMPGPANGTRIAIERAAAGLGVTLNVVAEADSMEAQRAMLKAGGCYTLLDPQAVKREMLEGLLFARPLVGPKIQRYVVVSTAPRRPLSIAARTVIGLIRKVYRKAN